MAALSDTPSATVSCAKDQTANNRWIYGIHERVRREKDVSGSGTRIPDQVRLVSIWHIRQTASFVDLPPLCQGNNRHRNANRLVLQARVNSTPIGITHPSPKVASATARRAHQQAGHFSIHLSVHILTTPFTMVPHIALGCAVCTSE
jgi:hypothetical protein